MSVVQLQKKPQNTAVRSGSTPVDTARYGGTSWPPPSLRASCHQELQRLTCQRVAAENNAVSWGLIQRSANTWYQEPVRALGVT